MEKGNQREIEEDPMDLAAEGHQNWSGLGVFRAPCPSFGLGGGFCLFSKLSCLSALQMCGRIPLCKLIKKSGT